MADTPDTPAERPAGSDVPDATPAEEPAGLEAARFEMRSAAYCVLCDAMVERAADGGCAACADHPAAALTGRVLLAEGEPVPQLGRFNLAAFLVPPVWGPAHGQWAGAVFLPIWMFMDSVIASAMGRGPWMALGAALVVATTVCAQAWFAKRANGLAWRRVSARMSVEEYMRRQRRWAIASIPLFVLLLGWGIYYRLVLAG